MKTSVDQYCINVTDLDKSVHFYEEVLGLDVATDQGACVIFATGNGSYVGVKLLDQLIFSYFLR